MKRWFFDHWEIKLLALVMSVTLYFYTATQARTEYDVVVQIQLAAVVGLDEGRIVTDLSPRKFDIVVDGPVAVFGEREIQVDPLLDVDEAVVQGDDELSFDVTDRLLRLDPNLRLRSSTVTRITVTTDLVVERNVACVVNVSDIEPPGPGLVVAAAKADQSQVKISGPKRLLDERLSAVLPIEPIVLRGVPADLTAPRDLVGVMLEPDLGEGLAQQIEIHQRGGLTATITVAPAPAERDIGVPVHLLLPPRYLERFQVELHQPESTLTLRGPRNRITALDPEQLVAYVRLPPVPKLDLVQELPILTIGPDWLQVESDTVQVTVRSRPAPEAEPPNGDPERPAGTGPGDIAPEPVPAP